MYSFKKFLVEMSYQDALKTLDLTTNFDNETLKKAYKKSALKNHPDKGGSEEEMKKVNDAYDTLKKMGGRSDASSGLKKTDHFAKYNDWAKIFSPVILSQILSNFKSDVWLKYFNSYSEKPLKVEVKEDPQYGNSYVGFTAEFFDNGRDTFFKFHFSVYLLNVYKKENTLGGGDLSYPLSVWMEGYHNGRKQKFKQVEYTATSDHKILKDPTVLVPTAKIKKMFATGSTTGKVKPVKKADVISHWKNKVGGDVIKDNFVLGNYGKGRYLRGYRFTIMKMPGYIFSNVNGASISPTTTFPESQLLIDMMTEFGDSFKNAKSDADFAKEVNSIHKKFKEKMDKK